MGYASPHQPLFNNVFDEYNFSIILNLFDNNNPLHLASINRHVETKCIIFGEGFKIRGKIFQQNFPSKLCKKH